MDLFYPMGSKKKKINKNTGSWVYINKKQVKMS